MASETAKNPQLPHGSVSEGRVVEDPLDLLDGDRVVDVLAPAGLDHH